MIQRKPLTSGKQSKHVHVITLTVVILMPEGQHKCFIDIFDWDSGNSYLPQNKTQHVRILGNHKIYCCPF